MNSTEKMNQAQYIWNRLDDLNATDPEAYQKFLKKQMEERDIYMSQPEARFCILTDFKKDNRSWKLFINVCAWKRLPYPKNDEEPLQIMKGFDQPALRKFEKTVPVAMNDKVLDELMKEGRKDLIQLILHFCREQLKEPTISDSYKEWKEIYYGTFPSQPTKLFTTANVGLSDSELNSLKNKFANNPKDILSSPEVLLSNLSSNEAEEQDGKTELENEDFVKNFMESTTSKKGKLIEEIGKTGPTQPDYTIKDGKVKDTTVVKINLPLVAKISECDLTISETSLELVASDKYQLKIDFPQKMNEDTANAKFNKKSSNLTVTLEKLQL